MSVWFLPKYMSQCRGSYVQSLGRIVRLSPSCLDGLFRRMGWNERVATRTDQILPARLEWRATATVNQFSGLKKCISARSSSYPAIPWQRTPASR